MDKKNIIISLIIVLISLITFSVGTYAYFTANIRDERNAEAKNNTTSLKTCHIAAATTVSNIPDSLGTFNIKDIYPGHKEVASFSVSATGRIGATSSFKFIYNIEENEFLDNIKVSVFKNDKIIPVNANYFECQKQTAIKNGVSTFYEKCKEKELGTLIKETTLTGEETIEIGRDTLLVRNENERETSYYYVVIEFLNKENQNNVMSSQLKGKVNIELSADSSLYADCILNGADPVLQESLIPVVIDDNGTVHVADIKKEWYNYTNRQWANAVILKNEEEVYTDIIPESKIESYFVWIPKFRYQLWDVGDYNDLTQKDESKVHKIPIIFGDYNTKDSIEGECTSPMESGSTMNCQIGDYMTHPAFISIPATGFWVGKFETSKENDLPDNSINPNGIEIKPNTISWRNINVSNIFFNTYNYKRTLESHMMKNTEWGAVAYLSHSEYGSSNKIRLNNNNDYITGYAAVKEPTCGYTRDNRDCNIQGNTADITKTYNTHIGYLASTTGNISGIYDMSGGSIEYVMGIISNQNGVLFSGADPYLNSGFIGPLSRGGNITNGHKFPEAKYYDKYGSGVNYQYKRGILGDATKEMGPFYINKGVLERQVSSWYENGAYFAYPDSPWMVRGGHFKNGSEGGIFDFDNLHGASNEFVTFRVVLTPNI